METIGRPSYLSIHEKGELEKRIQSAEALLAHCILCPRKCGINRLEDELGVCGTGKSATVSSYNPHFGEENPLVGEAGSGTIFLAHCNLLCVFCQNFEISHGGEGLEVNAEQLAAMMITLQRQGCHNINFVTPSHVVPQILAALPIAIEEGLHVPLVYNSSGYDDVDTLRLLDGIFDIYMPDFKFWNPETAKKLAKAPNYPERAREAIKEMHRQVGDLVINRSGLAIRGLLIRHLVMPGCLAETREILNFIAEEISPRTYVNVMEQYRPCGLAHKYPGINRPLRHEEYEEALTMARKAGLTRLDERNWERFIKRIMRL